MNIFRVWYRSHGDLRHEDFSTHLEALCYAKGLILLGIGSPLDIRDAQSGELIDSLAVLAA